VIALRLPDEPRWIEAHGIAADPASWRRTLGAGFAVGNDRARLMVVAGDAGAAAVAALAAELPDHTLLVPRERADLATATGRRVERALLQEGVSAGKQKAVEVSAERHLMAGLDEVHAAADRRNDAFVAELPERAVARAHECVEHLRPALAM